MCENTIWLSYCVVFDHPHILSIMKLLDGICLMKGNLCKFILKKNTICIDDWETESHMGSVGSCFLSHIGYLQHSSFLI